MTRHIEPISDEDLLPIVLEADRDLFLEGIDIRQRTWKVVSQVMQAFGYESYVMSGRGKPALVDRIEQRLREFYRPQDFASGGHIGVFMFRDIFAKISVPWIFGSVGFDPLDFVDLTPLQKDAIRSKREDLEMYLDQFNDVADIQYGYMEAKKPLSDIELLMRFAGLAKFHLHAASAVLTGGYDSRGAVQSALLAVELALKSGAAARGLTEAQIRSRFGHSLQRLVDYIHEGWPEFDADRVARTISKFPHYVPNRYSEIQPSRTEAGHIVMGAQYLVSEVIRQISDRRFRDGMRPAFPRRYPT